MNLLRPFEQTVRGYRTARTVERGAFGMLTGFSLSIAISRAINYIRERRRRAPRLRGLGRMLYTPPVRNNCEYITSSLESASHW